MTAAFFVPGFSLDRTLTAPAPEGVGRAMDAHGITLHGVTGGWGDYGVRDFGQRAVEQSRQCDYDGILIGHSLGALAALSVADAMPVRHLVLCSPSALFSEDIQANSNSKFREYLGEKRMQELANFSAADAVSLVNRLELPATVMFGEKEREILPHLVARSHHLAATIAGAELIEVPGASHDIGGDTYAHTLAEL